MFTIVTVLLCRGRHLLLTMTRDDIQLFSWYPDRWVLAVEIY
jgi:hypothetical protein